MKKIETKTDGNYLYSGAFDLSNENKEVFFYSNEKVKFNIQDVVGSFQNIEKYISISDIKQILKESNIKAAFYPNGDVRFSKLDSSNDELKTCYLSIITTAMVKYLVCIAFDETQPMLYKAQLISVFVFEDLQAPVPDQC